MDRILPPDPTQPTVVYTVASARNASRRNVRGRSLVTTVCAMGAIYLAFVVGAPWLLREAPPDTYAVIATKAACPAFVDTLTRCLSVQR